MGKRFLFLMLIMAVLGVPLGIVSASRPAQADTTPEVWDEEVPGEEEPAIDEPAIDDEDEVWNDEPDASSEDEEPGTAGEPFEPMPVPPQPAE